MAPGVKPTKFIRLVVLQFTCTNEVQLPLYTLNDMAVPAVSILVRLIRCAAPMATNENHTSSFMPVGLQVGAGKLLDGVALAVVPAVMAVQLKSGFTVRAMAAVHSSLGGGGGVVPTHILKLAVPAVVTLVYTLTL